ncbi:MAG: HK97 gp10 family phage protein [Candidatus Peribacteraceae bacterium]|nr:HK97 gp10 family phage protein [Candidatus Peribacteraceae bacterium]
MMYNLVMSNFSKRMNKLADLVTYNAQKIIREAGLVCASTAIQTTPVRTGNARINWRISFGGFRGGLSKAPNTSDVETNRQIASAQALINAANMIKTWRIGSGSIIIGNPVDYIVDLDQGSSKQATAGMSVFAIAAAKGVLQRGRLLRG